MIYIYVILYYEIYGFVSVMTYWPTSVSHSAFWLVTSQIN